ncbi:hypothetical protein [Helcococcus massiliensis]|uniref:hypothetical protein n=1 Tax=Helcococcus massiliensis TaxID=2040290 RepID=UPI001356648F|nr:hypothetical protein [Helcococcus massiliensis]
MRKLLLFLLMLYGVTNYCLQDNLTEMIVYQDDIDGEYIKPNNVEDIIEAYL